MIRRVGCFVVLALFLSVSLPNLSGQDLGSVARSTRQKRMEVMREHSVRIWTNDNIPKAPAQGRTAAAGISATSGPPAETASTAAPGASATPAPAAEDAADKKKTREYWQQRFKSVRKRLDAMMEQQRLAEDELSLLQVQEVRELSPTAKRELEPKVKAASAEAEAKRLQTAKVREELEELEKEFKESGAPADWSKTD